MTSHTQQAPQDLNLWLAILRAPGIGPIRYQKLLKQFGSPSQILRAKPIELAALKIPNKSINALQNPDWQQIEKDLRWQEQKNCYVISRADPHYPALLNEIPDPPPLLFFRGRLDVLHLPQIAIVGSRNASQSGLNNARRFASDLCQSGLSITSGLALGIDASAHLGALDSQGPTLAVMGTGPDSVYPRRHKTLAQNICEHGGLISEFPPGTQPLAENFPRRNRIISGLSLGTLVIEATPKSGSLITAHLATDQGREVFAVPGSIHNPTSRGCHMLIRQGAKLVESIQDILEELPIEIRTSLPVSNEKNDTNIKHDANTLKLLSVLDYDPLSIDTLIKTSQLTPEAVSSILLTLELQDLVNVMPGGLYTRTPP